MAFSGGVADGRELLLAWEGMIDAAFTALALASTFSRSLE